MCVSFFEADFKNTIVFADATHDGQHLLGYQNQAENRDRSRTLNAMILPLPAANKLGPQDMIETEACHEIFTDMKETLAPPPVDYLSRGFAVAAGGGFSKEVQIFKSGAYTVLLTANAAFIKLALTKLPEKERPEISNEIIEAYQEWYPGWQMAVCIWQGSIEANPILWKFDPMYPEKLFLPGVDSHNGRRPDLGRRVERDHSLVVGSRYGTTVKFSEVLTPELDHLLPRKVKGMYTVPSTKNGDWWVSLADLNSGGCNFEVKAPPGAN
jgi:hypothetical protein